LVGDRHRDNAELDLDPADGVVSALLRKWSQVTRNRRN
jgi:hypothetical protein